MLSLPCAGTYQHNCDGCITNEVVTDMLADSLRRDIYIVYVAFLDRFIYNIVPHHLYKPVLVSLVFVVKADEYFMS